ncbi:SagB family peptide dehydrogenase [Pseudomonas sp. S32]|uniref:SagB family peptide dehydrogenase n=1 Tax=Pseudomonas sp. S32 TaxID=2767448 RepID=UPI001911FCDD|nr:SagB family peptide dehydrogenase [Pseudomonas sp. S32]MBK5007057.1 SagB/ThcOx family dehydrogenase [Pseudomonas sp. S32]
MINKNCFFIDFQDSLVCWDFKQHKQYQLSSAHAIEVINHIYGGADHDDSVDVMTELRGIGIIAEEGAQTHLWEWDILSRIFHIGTKDLITDDQPSNETEWAVHYLAHCDEALQQERFSSDQAEGDGFVLPRWDDSDEVSRVMGQRITVRNFKDAPVSLVDLGRILQQTLGFSVGRSRTDCTMTSDPFAQRRLSPSAGGLNATEGYVYVSNVTGLDPGFYYYDPQHHSLHWRGELVSKLGDLVAGQHFVNNVPVGLFLTSRFDKLWWKYKHSRAYRMALIEVGHVAQTFQLSATATGMQTWLTGALNDSLVEQRIALDNPCEHVLFFVACGYSEGAAIPDCMRELLTSREADQK